MRNVDEILKEKAKLQLSKEVYDWVRAINGHPFFNAIRDAKLEPSETMHSFFFDNGGATKIIMEAQLPDRIEKVAADFVRKVERMKEDDSLPF